jgi:8-oxo-dGTP pyrophosphatase MutT (NUDIX family)
MDFKVLWKGKYLTVVSPAKYPYEAVYEKNGIISLPILNVKGRDLFVIRKEFCPPYMIHGGEQLFYTVLSGQIDGNDSADDTLLREIREESGIIVKKHTVLWKKTMPVNKSTSALGNYYILRITEFETEIPKGDGGAYEKASKTIFVPADQMESILQKPNVDFQLTGIYSVYKSLKGAEKS